MGGYATYRLGTLYPDLFGKAFTQVGPPGDGIWIPPARPDRRHRDADEPVARERAQHSVPEPRRRAPMSWCPIVGPRAQNLGAPELGIRGFDQLGYRFRFLVVSPSRPLRAWRLAGYDLPDRADVPRRRARRPQPAARDVLVHARGGRSRRSASSTTMRTGSPACGSPTRPQARPPRRASSTRGAAASASATRRARPARTPAPFSIFTYVETNRTWGPPPATPVENRLDATLTNVNAGRVSTWRARRSIRPSDAGRRDERRRCRPTLALDGGPFPACSVVLEDGVVLGLLPGPTGVTPTGRRRRPHLHGHVRGHVHAPPPGAHARRAAGSIDWSSAAAPRRRSPRSGSRGAT